MAFPKVRVKWNDLIFFAPAKQQVPPLHISFPWGTKCSGRDDNFLAVLRFLPASPAHLYLNNPSIREYSTVSYFLSF